MQDHTRSHKSNEATHGHDRENRQTDHTRLYKAIKDHIRPYKAIQGKHSNSITKCTTEDIFCSLAQFLLNLEYFLLMIPRQSQEQEQQQNFF